MRPSVQPSCAIVRRWERASASLAKSLTAYLEACLSLEAKYQWASNTPTKLVPLIDSKLDGLHSVMDEQLSESRSTLARTRNRLASPVYRLSEEILSEIFFDVLYLPDQDDSKVPRMEDRLPAIYRNLHSLLGVCSFWRDIAIHYSALWSVIPVYNPSNKDSVYRATALSLKRAGKGPLHFAAVTSKLPQRHLRLFHKHISRFHSINIRAETHSSIASILEVVVDGDPVFLRELSIRYELRNPEVGWPPIILPETKRLPYDAFSQSQRAAFQQLILNLSVIRLSGMQLDWDSITFTTRLSKLRLQAIALGDEREAWMCLKAISTATQLHDLQIISVIIGLGGATDQNNGQDRRVGFPSLKSLRLEDLTFNAMLFFNKAILPGSYQLTLSLTENSKRFAFLEPGEVRFVELSAPDMNNLLKDTSIHTLHLDYYTKGETEWLSTNEIRSLLESHPELKTLTISSATFRAEDWAALAIPEKGRFPRLETLGLIYADIFDTDGIKDIVKSHPITRIELGGFLSGHNEGKGELSRRIQAGEEIVGWLSTNVPEFQLLEPFYGPPDVEEGNWQLW